MPEPRRFSTPMPSVSPTMWSSLKRFSPSSVTYSPPKTLLSNLETSSSVR